MKAPAPTPPDRHADQDVDLDIAALIDRAQHHAFSYFEATTDPASGLVLDSTQPDSPCSIAGVGMALTAYPIAVERGWMTRAAGRGDHAATLRFFADADMSGSPQSTGHRGFYFHFLDMRTGRRAWKSELSTIDTSLLVAGMLAAASYFDRDTTHESEIRATARMLEERVDWAWMRNCDGAICHGWKPERGFLRYHWRGYSEGLLMMALALGSERHPCRHRPGMTGFRATAGAASMATNTSRPGRCSSTSTRTCGSTSAASRTPHARARHRLFREQPPRDAGAARVRDPQPQALQGLLPELLGPDRLRRPGPARDTVDGRKRRLLGYAARGAPYGPDDGTVAPWASVASLPFAPDVVIPTMQHIARMMRKHATTCRAPRSTRRGATARARRAGSRRGASRSTAGRWSLMIENYRSGLPWTADAARPDDPARLGAGRLPRRLAVGAALIQASRDAAGPPPAMTQSVFIRFTEQILSRPPPTMQARAGQQARRIPLRPARAPD